MAKNFIVGIDIGSETTRVAVSLPSDGGKEPTLLSVGSVPTKGMRHGYVRDVALVSSSISRAVFEAEKNLNGKKIKRAFVSIGGISLSSQISIGTAIISKADNEVTNLDIEKAIKESETHADLTNKRKLYVQPIGFRLDGKEVHGTPEGMRGIKLETRVLYVSILEQHAIDLESAVLGANISIIDFIPTPLSASVLALSERQKAVGGALVVLGAECMSIAVFENDVPIAIHGFPIGSNDITNDIALGLRISLEEAEGIKIGSITEHPKKKVDEIVDARVREIFDVINSYLKKLKRSELLPAGVSLVGGGALLSNIESIAKEELHLPVFVGIANNTQLVKSKLRDPSWLVAYGLCMKNNLSGEETREIVTRVKPFTETIKKFFEQFRP